MQLRDLTKSKVDYLKILTSKLLERLIKGKREKEILYANTYIWNLKKKKKRF